jgi:hypothetical protein
VIPKHHGEKLTDIPDDALTEILVRLPIPIPTPDKTAFLTKRQLRRGNEC